MWNSTWNIQQGFRAGTGPSTSLTGDLCEHSGEMSSLTSPPFHPHFMLVPRGTCGKESVCQCRRLKRHGLDPGSGGTPWRRKWQPTPVFLLGQSHGQRLVGCSPWGCRELDTTGHISVMFISTLILHRSFAST